MDALELLKEIKRRMIDGTPLDVGMAFDIEACICTMESARASAEAGRLERIAEAAGEPPDRRAGPTVVVADTVEALNEALNDPVPADAQATGGFPLNPFRRS